MPRDEDLHVPRPSQTPDGAPGSGIACCEVVQECSLARSAPVPLWPSGTYTGTYSVKRGAEIVIEKRFELVL